LVDAYFLSIMATHLFLGFLLLTSAGAAPQASPVSILRSTVTIETSTSAASATASPLPSLTTEERDELFSLHEKIVNIPSISSNELECADYISDYLEELGYYVDKVPVGNTSTYNVFAYPTTLKDEGVWPEVLITSHIDTVCILKN
jgi:acetylornithine deacetylase